MNDTGNRSARPGTRIALKDLRITKRAAGRTIARAPTILLSVEDQARVEVLLIERPKPGAALKRAFAAHRELISSSE
jgi:uncharacterized protein (DUF1778 family)